MDTLLKANDLVRTQPHDGAGYKRNYVKQVVCELRFPTLMELGDERPPSGLVKALRKDYPLHEVANEMTFSFGSTPGVTNHAHIFRSLKGGWQIALKHSAITLETSRYTGFETLKARVAQMAAAALPVIDSDYFTRLGLRYINDIAPENDEDPAKGWVNTVLTGPLGGSDFGGVADYSGKLQLTGDDGGCLLQHGLKFSADGVGKMPSYTIDIDAYRTAVDSNDLEDALIAAHAQAYAVFDWAVGDKGREYLSKA